MTKKLGLRVRQLREARALTLEVAAERASLDWKHFQKIESGQINATLATLWRLAKGFRVTLQDLFEGVD